MTSAAASGRGIAREMCEHSFEHALCDDSYVGRLTTNEMAGS